MNEQVRIIKEYYGDEARKAYKVFYDEEDDNLVEKVTIWSNERISFRRSTYKYHIFYDERTFEEWLKNFEKQVEEMEAIK